MGLAVYGGRLRADVIQLVPVGRQKYNNTVTSCYVKRMLRLPVDVATELLAVNAATPPIRGISPRDGDVFGCHVMVTSYVNDSCYGGSTHSGLARPMCR